MIETVSSYNSFWLIIFSSIVIVAIGGIIAFVVVKLKNKDTDIFFKSNDNAKEITIDTTTKMANMHTEVVDGIPTQYQHELHSIEETVKKETTRLDKLVDDMEEVNQKLDILLEWKFETERKQRKKKA